MVGSVQVVQTSEVILQIPYHPATFAWTPPRCLVPAAERKSRR
jgi:hypothetical protein